MASFKKILRSIKSTLSDSDSASETSSSASHTSSARSSRAPPASLRRRSRGVHESTITYQQSMEAYPEPPPKPPRGRIQPEKFTSHLDDLHKLGPTTSASLQKNESLKFEKDKSDTHYKRLIRKLGKDKSTLNQKIEELGDQLSVYVRNHEKMTTAFIRANSKLHEEQKTTQILASQNELLGKRLESAMKRIAHLERLEAIRSKARASVSSDSSSDVEGNFACHFDTDSSSVSEMSSFVRQDFKRRPRRPLILSTQTAVVFV